ncbi:MAG: family peptidase [Gemmatimonadetes bacterium]|nr:family peptidase [Gemmatimonadota bacterium]
MALVSGSTVRATIAVACGTAIVAVSPAMSQSTPRGSSPPRLIPIEALYESPVMQWGGISPDGRWLSYMKSWHGHQNVFVRPVGSTRERAVTRDSVRSIGSYWWSGDGKRILWLQDRGGDENYHLFAADIADTTGSVRDLTPFKNIEVEVLALPSTMPGTAIITLNRRDPTLADAYRVDLATSALELAAQNPGTFLGYVADRRSQVRAAYAVDSAGHYQLFARESEAAPWRMVKSYAVEDKITPLRFTANGSLYMTSNEGTDLARLVLVDLSTGREIAVDSDPLKQVDIDQILFDDVTGELLMTRYIGDTARLYPKTSDMEALLAATRRAGGGVVEMGGGTNDRSRWVVTLNTPTKPSVTYLYSSQRKTLEKFYDPRPGLRSYRFAEKTPVSFQSRDGLRIGGYVTLPPGRPAHALPLVVLVHGGPWGDRDKWEFDSDVQLLANRGYVVLQVNYRGTTGLGKKFARAAKKQFGRAMHDDLLDGISYLASRGMIDTSRIAIMGGSYGGYATLVGLTFPPDRFACGVD